MIEGIVFKVHDLGDGSVLVSFLEEYKKGYFKNHDVSITKTEYGQDRFAIGDIVFLQLGRVYKQ